jgi:hypothetical protein
MSELYGAIAGSPITYLSSDISASQTTISIADDSALPDAPNICTIGYGEELETIKYGAKSNGVLQNVTRGIEGTPRAWPAGTEVARFFTAYDYNALIENFNSHLADVAKQDVLWSGDAGVENLTLNGNPFDYAYIAIVVSNAEGSSTHRGIALTIPWTSVVRVATVYFDQLEWIRLNMSTSGVSIAGLSSAYMRIKEIRGVAKVK